MQVITRDHLVQEESGQSADEVCMDQGGGEL